MQDKYKVINSEDNISAILLKNKSKNIQLWFHIKGDNHFYQSKSINIDFLNKNIHIPNIQPKHKDYRSVSFQFTGIGIIFRTKVINILNNSIICKIPNQLLILENRKEPRFKVKNIKTTLNAIIESNTFQINAQIIDISFHGIKISIKDTDFDILKKSNNFKIYINNNMKNIALKHYLWVNKDKTKTSKKTIFAGFQFNTPLESNEISSLTNTSNNFSL